jgi:ribosomal protein L29
MGSLYQQSVSSQAVQAATLKAQMSTMSAANIEFIKEIKNNLAAIDSATAGMTKEDADAVKKSLKRELFQKIGFGVN